MYTVQYTGPLQKFYPDWEPLRGKHRTIGAATKRKEKEDRRQGAVTFRLRNTFRIINDRGEVVG